MTEYFWKHWPEGCPECGGALQVFSDCHKEDSACDGDKVRCPECGTIGQISADAETPPYAVFLDWDFIAND